MELLANHAIQSLHTQGEPEVDWVAVQEVERDICLLYHQLADYSYIMGDLYYGNVYALPYWEYLCVPGLDESQQEFIREGCLVMIFGSYGICCVIKTSRSPSLDPRR